MACLYLLEGYLKNITVLWANTGRNYPEATFTIAKARKLCPNWIEIKTDRVGQWEVNGLPSDLVPIDHTVDGQKVTSEKKITIQSYLQCCHENIAKPLWDKSVELGATLIIRGQRNDETHRANARNGTMLDGVQFWHPLEDWSKTKVISFLKEKMRRLPKQYILEHSSMDCFDCTAFAAHSHDRARYSKEHHPALHREHQDRLDEVRQAIFPTYEQYVRLEDK